MCVHSLLSALVTLCLALSAGSASPASATTSPATRPSDPNNAATHYLEVEARLAALPEGQQVLLRRVHREPLSPETAALVQQTEETLAVVRRGNAAPRIGLPLDLTKPLTATTPLTEAAWRLVQLTRLHYRQHVVEGRSLLAVEEVLATWHALRRIGATPLLIYATVDRGAESVLATAVAAEMPRLGPEALRRFQTGLVALPPVAKLGPAMAQEQTYDRAWMEQAIARPEDLASHIRQWRQIMPERAQRLEELAVYLKDKPQQARAEGQAVAVMYARLAQVVDGPLDVYEQTRAKIWQEMKESGNVVFRTTMAEPDSFLDATAVRRLWGSPHEARMAMLEAALAYQLEGAEGLQRIRDPFGTGPFYLNRVGGGFVLASKLINPFSNRPEQMEVGVAVGAPTTATAP